MKPQQHLTIEDYFGKAAGLKAPWRTEKCEVNDASKTVHMWVTNQAITYEQRHGWFGVKNILKAPKRSNSVEQHWRHLDCMDYACVIHVSDPIEPVDYDLDWLGPLKISFTNRMAKKIFLLLMEGMELQLICEDLRIPFTDLWKFKYELDNGLLNFEYTPSAQRKRKDANLQLTYGAEHTSANAADLGASIEAPIRIPEMFDPVWEQLITGALKIQIKTLSFQLLLTKLSQQVNLLQSPDVKIMKLRELHRYVERHARVLKHELAQLTQH